MDCSHGVSKSQTRLSDLPFHFLAHFSLTVHTGAAGPASEVSPGARPPALQTGRPLWATVLSTAAFCSPEATPALRPRLDSHCSQEEV